MLFLVWKIYLEVYGGNQLINLKVEKYFALFNLEKISSTLGIGQVDFLVMC